ncbi:uncharacterized protein LOC135841420 [Planococcus citri]|uniref:uncharacterized protein LOC135841420 n=1 Tax=Planococcus citri TaxID=170843 RepID=UPI0031F9DA59
MQVAKGLISHLQSHGLTDDISLTFIEEVHGSNASFIISSLICDALKNDASVLFLTFHNPFQHYQQLCSKLGVNLNSPAYKSKIENISPLNSCIEENSSDESVLQKISKETDDFFRKHREDKMYLIIDDISYVLMLSSFQDCSRFVRYYVYQRSLYPNLKVVICSHTVRDDKESVTIANYIRSICKFIIKLTPLKSGLSSEVTGHMEIIRSRGFKSDVTNHKYLLNRKEIVLNPLVI